MTLATHAQPCACDACWRETQMPREYGSSGLAKRDPTIVPQRRGRGMRPPVWWIDKHRARTIAQANAELDDDTEIPPVEHRATVERRPPPPKPVIRLDIHERAQRIIQRAMAKSIEGDDAQ